MKRIALPRLIFVLPSLVLLASACGNTGTSASNVSIPTPTASPVSYLSAQGTIVPGGVAISDASGALQDSIIKLDNGTYYLITVTDFTPQPKASDLQPGTAIALVYQPQGFNTQVEENGELVTVTAYNVVQFTANGQIYKTAKYPPPILDAIHRV